MSDITLGTIVQVTPKASHARRFPHRGKIGVVIGLDCDGSLANVQFDPENKSLTIVDALTVILPYPFPTQA